MKQEKLEPCPFCGGEPRVVEMSPHWPRAVLVMEENEK